MNLIPVRPICIVWRDFGLYGQNEHHIYINIDSRRYRISTLTFPRYKLKHVVVTSIIRHVGPTEEKRIVPLSPC